MHTRHPLLLHTYALHLNATRHCRVRFVVAASLLLLLLSRSTHARMSHTSLSFDPLFPLIRRRQCLRLGRRHAPVMTSFLFLLSPSPLHNRRQQQRSQRHSHRSPLVSSVYMRQRDLSCGTTPPHLQQQQQQSNFFCFAVVGGADKHTQTRQRSPLRVGSTLTNRFVDMKSRAIAELRASAVDSIASALASYEQRILFNRASFSRNNCSTPEQSRVTVIKQVGCS